jgi:hypothetical protein
MNPLATEARYIESTLPRGQGGVTLARVEVGTRLPRGQEGEVLPREEGGTVLQGLILVHHSAHCKRFTCDKVCLGGALSGSM